MTPNEKRKIESCDAFRKYISERFDSSLNSTEVSFIKALAIIWSGQK